MQRNSLFEGKKSINSTEIVNAIKAAKTAVVVAHVNPDGDTLASMLALAKILEDFGLETVHRVMHDEVPAVYKFFPGQEKVLCSMKEADKEQLLSEYDLSFSCDCGSVERLGSAGHIWKLAKLTCNIDHHLSNPLYADLNWVDADATCTGQVVRDILLALNESTANEQIKTNSETHRLSINKDLASLFYITLLTDTGGFRHSNTNANVFKWAAELTNLGANPSILFNLLFNQMPFRTIKTIGAALYETEILELDLSSFSVNPDLLKLFPEAVLRLAYATTTKETLSKFSAKEEDTDEIVDHLMRIKEVNMCLYLREDLKKDLNFKGSLRSNCDVDCSRIAAKLNGGGHARAAGFNCTANDFQELKEIVLQKILEY